MTDRDSTTRRGAILKAAARRLLPARWFDTARHAWRLFQYHAMGRIDVDLQLLFHAPYYLETNPDVARRCRNPFAHFLQRGWREGRSPHPMFDLPFYVRCYPHVVGLKINPVVHFLACGWRERCNPNRLFDCEFYLRTNAKVAAAGINPVLHYMRHGHAEGLAAGPLFQTPTYRELHPECDTSGVDPLSHYLWRGSSENSWPPPLPQIDEMAFEQALRCRRVVDRSKRTSYTILSANGNDRRNGCAA